MRVCFTVLIGCLAKFAPFSQLMGSQIHRLLVPRDFPRLAPEYMHLLRILIGSLRCLVVVIGQSNQQLVTTAIVCFFGICLAF